MSHSKIHIKDKLNADSLNELLKNNFAKLKYNRDDNKSIKLSDILMSAYAMFSLKQPSLLTFKDTYSADKRNLKSVFQISKAPSDNEMRKVIDNIEPAEIKSIFPKI